MCPPNDNRREIQMSLNLTITERIGLGVTSLSNATIAWKYKSPKNANGRETEVSPNMTVGGR